MTPDLQPPSPALGRVLVVVPTYDERANLPGALERLRACVPAADVLVVDDGSPDGTGQLAEDFAEGDAARHGRTAIHVMHRSGKQGLGTAYVAGFRWGLERDYDVIVEMDADGSHRAEDLPSLLAALDGADLVLGSRWVPGGAVVNWPLSRQLLSRGGNTYTRLALGLPLRDATGGFRAYRAQMLRKLDLADVESHGYCFQVDMAWRVLRAGGTAVEVPITFVERALGESKMSRDIVVEALTKVTVWGAQHRLGQLRSAARRVAGRAPGR
ncbi:polyprenol monophosphomannose synthase [Cellulomonas cellasea]|uniref:polyprenol monophosphomannose synthase n=1 Tax=Cellulomonas cellasea TaxID=43670 RepID=UPI0025A3F3A7|nr:polyprenol monophosphomannose synthase [Cellulomonas cellasea]MDM8083873.1 polyprenol monophosphomannose synthase [Cellulomonas cellasea]